MREIKSFLMPFSNAASARGSRNCNSIRTKCVQTHIPLALSLSFLEHIGDAGIFIIKIMANEINKIARLVFIMQHATLCNPTWLFSILIKPFFLASSYACLLSFIRIFFLYFDRRIYEFFKQMIDAKSLMGGFENSSTQPSQGYDFDLS